MMRLERASGSAGTGWMIAVLCIGNFLAYFDRSIINAVLPLVKTDFALSDRDLGLLQGSLFALAYVAGSLCCWWAPPRRATMLLRGGIAVWTIGEAGASMSVGVVQLAAAQILVGLGQAAFIPVALSFVAAERGRVGFAVSLFTASSTLGRSLSVLCAGLALVWLSMLHTGTSWRSLYGGMAGAGAILLIVMLPVLRRERFDLEARRIYPVHGASLMSYLRRCIGIVAITLPVILLTQSIAAWMPMMLSRTEGTGVSQAAILVGFVTLLTSPIGQMCGGWLIDRSPAFAERPFHAISGCMVVACLAVLAMRFTNGRVPLLLALGLVNVVLGIASLTALATLQTLIPPSLRSRINALFLAIVTAVGFGLGPVIVGSLSDLRGDGLSALKWAIGLVAIGATAICLGVDIIVSVCRHAASRLRQHAA